MPFWENEDGTFEYRLLVTGGEKNHATVDNPENQRKTAGNGAAKEGSTSDSGTRTFSSNRAIGEERWRGVGHSQR